MKSRTLAALGLTVLIAGACDTAGPLDPVEEESLALSLASDGAQVMDGHQARPQNWIARLIRGINRQGSPEAVALLEEARGLRAEAREARLAGDTTLFFSLMEQSRTSLFGAVVLTFPNAPERTGEAVDDAVARITEKLGDRDAPRIRAVLASVEELRAEADAALADGDLVAALDLNFQAARRITRMVHFLRDQRDGASDRPMGQRELSDHVEGLQF